MSYHDGYQFMTVHTHCDKATDIVSRYLAQLQYRVMLGHKLDTDKY